MGSMNQRDLCLMRNLLLRPIGILLLASHLGVAAVPIEND